MLFDTHAHLNDPAFDNDRESLLESLPGQGIGYVMNAGCSLQSSKDIIALAEKYDYLYASVGSHPDSCDEVNDEVLDEYRALCRHPKVKAIGEIGLDYYYEDIPRDTQKKAFITQLELAREVDLPVIVHERDAHGDGMDIVRRFPDVTGVFHCFSGSAEMAKWLVDRGWYIGFTGVITFKNARRSLEIIEWLPMDRIMVETDAPYMAPVPMRGKRNESSYIPYICARVAELTNCTVEQIAEQTTRNAERIFGLE